MPKEVAKPFCADDEVVSAAKVGQLKRQVPELKRVLGHKAMEDKISRDAVRSSAHRQSGDIAIESALVFRWF